MAAFHTQRHEPANRRSVRSVPGRVQSWKRKALIDMETSSYLVAKYRRKAFDRDAIEQLRTIFAKVCEDFDAKLVEMEVSTIMCICCWRTRPRSSCRRW